MGTKRVWKAGPDRTATQVSGQRVGADDVMFMQERAIEAAAPGGRTSICGYE